jgi:hypothetical protein
MFARSRPGSLKELDEYGPSKYICGKVSQHESKLRGSAECAR